MRARFVRFQGLLGGPNAVVDALDAGVRAREERLDQRPAKQRVHAAAFPAETAQHIVEIQLDHLRTRLADRRITLDITDAAMASLAEAGFDPAYGARPLKRVIQRELGDQAAMLILEGRAHEGSTIRVDVAGEDRDTGTASLQLSVVDFTES
jgi:ATP-dependent Clp protease ATP-binding subunit ClpB